MLKKKYYRRAKQKIDSILEKAIPAPIYKPAGRVVHRTEAILSLLEGAVRHVYYAGHIQTALRDRPYDKKGRPSIWYSPSMMDFFRTIDFRDKSILEFGAGHSTLWWSRHAKSVCAMEDNDDWYQYLSPKVADNVNLIEIKEDPNVAWETVKDQKFDLIIVDCNGGSMDRVICNEWATKLVTDNGAILFDNSEEDMYKRDSIPMFKEKGFKRVDFYGIGATKAKPQCSSILFKGDCFLWEGNNPPPKLNEYDDDQLAHTPFKP